MEIPISMYTNAKEDSVKYEILVKYLKKIVLKLNNADEIKEYLQKILSSLGEEQYECKRDV